MFGLFNNRKDDVLTVAPGTPSDKVSFEATELFAIMGGLDFNLFICTPNTMPSSEYALNHPDEWKRRTVARLGPAGIVDDECNPCPELEQLIAPLRKPGIYITNGLYSVESLGIWRDTRSMNLVGTPECATLVRSIGKGFHRTFTLSNAGSIEGWYPQILKAAHLPETTPAVATASVPFLSEILDETDFANSLFQGDIPQVRAFAERIGADPNWLEVASNRLSKTTTFSVTKKCLKL